jgi:hypothetical protein
MEPMESAKFEDEKAGKGPCTVHALVHSARVRSCENAVLASREVMRGRVTLNRGHNCTELVPYSFQIRAWSYLK